MPVKDTEKAGLAHLSSRVSGGIPSPALPPLLQRKGPLCPQKTCQGRTGGPGPSSAQLKIQICQFAKEKSVHSFNDSCFDSLVDSLYHQ